MRVISCMIVLAILCTTGAGCSLFKKNTNGVQGPAGGGATPPKFPAINDPLVPTPPTLPTAPMTVPGATPTSASKGTSVLAGTVVDAYHRPMGNAYVRWVSLDDKNAGAPIDVAADAHGHFIIQGVKQGAAYRLIARTKLGDKMLAGAVLTSAPNVRVLIPIREELANSDTPALPGNPAEAIGGDKNGATPPDPLIGLGSAKPAAEPSLPTTIKVPGPSVRNPTFVPGVVENPLKDRLPTLIIPPNKGPLPPLKPNDSKLDTGPTRVPSCVLVGNHLENLALKDSKGQTWEYKKHGAGKLILIDFWGTHCIYCKDSMPALNRLNQQYSGRGLEVLGIAIEKGADERREAEAVNRLCTSMQLTYRQLMGHVGAFDAGKHFRIEGLPTLILLSEQGDILWHHVGRPDPAVLSGLERMIQSRLANRPF
ncbi:MAG: redoxin domain-containing protein [Gemmataceae bacterium]|nr:redoxin domain-containing protein [Gemmataceae bacterium]